ncbi:MAG: hypothetical protein HC831_20495 [Chloroflexia bacterium]|nr:hypothetical protein [Chloroflexia bacterium]
MLLKPNSGIGELIFGQSESDVRQILGFPDIIDESWDNKEELVYQYYRHKLSLYFYLEEGGKLGYIKCTNPNLRFKDYKLIQQNVSTVKNVITGSSTYNWEEEHYEFYQTYFSAKHWITLVVKYNEVIELEAGIPYLNKNRHDWNQTKMLMIDQNVLQ